MRGFNVSAVVSILSVFAGSVVSMGQNFHTPYMRTHCAPFPTEWTNFNEMATCVQIGLSSDPTNNPDTNPDPLFRAQQAATKLREYRNTYGQAAVENFGVWIQNFGNFSGSSTFGGTSIYRTVDGIGEPSSFWYDTSSNSVYWSRVQPWMTEARKDNGLVTYNANFSDVTPKKWMRLFLNELKRLLDVEPKVPYPKRWQFDVELKFVGNPESSTFMQHLQQALADPRWTTELVPGFGKTMATLYQEEAAYWNLPANQLSAGTLFSPPATQPFAAVITDTVNGIVVSNSLDDGKPFSRRNMRYTLWYASVLERSRQAAFKEVAYDQIHSVFHEVDPKINNYAQISVDGLEDNGYGWTQTRTANSDSGFPVQYIPTRRRIRSLFDHVHLNSDTARYPDAGGNRGDWATNGRWKASKAGRRLPGGGVADGSLYAFTDFDGPLLYPNKWSGFGPVGESAGQPNYYLPGAPSDATPWLTALRFQRMEIESTTNSYGGGRQKKIAPWIAPPGKEGGTSDTLRDQFALFKSKLIPEVMVYNAISLDDYKNTSSLYHQAFDPTVTSYTIAAGTAITPTASNTPVPAEPDKSRITDTVRRKNSANNFYDHELAITAVPFLHVNWETEEIDGWKWSTMLQVDVNNMTRPASDPYNGSCGLDIYLENRLTTPNTSPLAPMLAGYGAPAKGRIFLWKYSTSTWTEILLADATVVPHQGYLYYTPDTSTRLRVPIDDAAPYVSPTGELKLRLGVERYLSAPGCVSPNPPEGYSGPALCAQDLEFNVFWDLVQVVYRCNPAVPPGGQSLMAGGGAGNSTTTLDLAQSDYTMDHAVALDDANTFVSDWLSEVPLADINLDGVIDGLDIVEFMQAYANEQ